MIKVNLTVPVDVLVHMSAPDAPHAPLPLRDDGFGIRFYGLGLALGYDWLYDSMSADQRIRVFTAIDRWLDAYEGGGFGRDHPQGNYFAGYYATKAVAALATEGDNPRAPAQWSDFLTRVHGQMVQPYYAANLNGGGWPEGQEYGLLATFNMVLPVVAAKTAKGIDLVDAAAPYRFPSGAANWYLYNTWPSLLRVDDRGTMHTQPEPAPAPVKVITQLAGMLPTWDDPLAAAFHRFARDVRAANPTNATSPDQLWSDFLFWNPAAPEADYQTSPLASYAQGMEMGVVRSSWATAAVWGSFNAGPYTNNPDSGEQLFDAGSLAIARGNRPFLVNATGQLFRGTVIPGGKVDDFIHDDNFTDGKITRGLYNVFYTDRPTPTGQGAHTRAQGARTRMGVFDPTDVYVFMRATQLEDMYPAGNATATISSWTRDVMYLPPNLFVVYDRTTVTDSTVRQWMRFHFASALTDVANPSPDLSRYDIGSDTTYAGTVSCLLPTGHQEKPTPTIFSSKVDSKVVSKDVSRLDIGPQPSTPVTQNQWLTVFDAAATAAEAARARRLSAADGNVLAGAVIGVLLQASTSSFAALSGTGPAGTPTPSPISYRVPATNTLHVITDLAPSADYTVTAPPDSGDITVDITADSGSPTNQPIRTSQAGVLSFTTTIA